MASNYFEYEGFEINNETSNADRYVGEVAEGTSNYISRRRYNKPAQNYRFQKQNNYRGEQENKYKSNRPRYDGNVKKYDKNENTTSDEVHNLVQDSSNMTTGSSYYHQKRNMNPRYSRYSHKNNSFENENVDVQELTDVAADQQIHSPPHLGTTTPKHWNKKKNYKGGYYSGHHGGQEESEVFNPMGKNENLKRRNNYTFNQKDGETSNLNGHKGSRWKDGGEYEEKRRPSWSPKIEESKEANQFDESYENTSYGRLKYDEPKQDTYENQRELLMDQLRRNSYECLVCCSSINRKTSIWSCSTCFNIFHLACIKKWAKSSAVEVLRVGEEKVEGEKKFWRCPTCQNSSSQVPNDYWCFCGKLRNPELSFDAPHSCGELCGKKRGRFCKHPCNILCHPGPCPPCVATVTTTCGCGKKTTCVKCNMAVDLKCEEVCNKSLNCGNHACTEVCHKGSCRPCRIEVEQTCHCGKQGRRVACGAKESFLSSYSCMDKCDKLMDCKNHSCSKICHPGDCLECLLKPELINHCACGKSDVHSLLLLRNEQKSDQPIENVSMNGKKSKKKKKKSNPEDLKEEESCGEICWPRTSCLDPLPRCGQTCGKELPCGSGDNRHFCTSKCHNGPCHGCPETSTVVCSCMSNLIMIPCKELLSKLSQGQKIKCGQKCREKLSCGRHVCTANCCTDAEHVCKKMCKRNLSCGHHKCPDRCHPGKCEICWLTGFEELTCRCGAQVIYPPVPCGTRRPQCHRPCIREHACNHEVQHSCHDDETCPPCVHLTERLCLCGKELRKNVPCYQQDVRCGHQCGKVLPCGTHFCLRSCHKDACLDAQNPKCTQPCQLSRSSCGHPCMSPCHTDEPCPITECTAEVVIKCECERKEGKTFCKLRGGSNDVNLIPGILNLLISSNKTILKGDRLSCDKECTIQKRNKKLADALNIVNPNLTSEPEITVNYSDFLKDSVKKNVMFVSKVEHDLQELVKGAKMLQHDNDRKCHSFKVMKREQRHVVHELAECYGVDTESQDDEPYRNVVARATKSKCRLPKISLVQTCSNVAKSTNPLPSNPANKPTAIVSPAPVPTKREVQQPIRTPRKPAIDYFDYED